MNHSLNSTLKLETLSDSGKAPKFRLDSATEAVAIVEVIKKANADRNARDARIKGMIDGNKPFDDAKLKANAQSWRTNVNWLEGKAALSAALTPYYDLFSSGKHYATVQVRCDNDPVKSHAYSQIVSEEFDRLLKDYDGFDFNMQRMFHDRIAYGKGFVMWPDEISWQFKAIPHYLVLVPNRTDATLTTLEILVVRQEYQVHELYKAIKDEKAASTRGWNVKAVQKAIKNAVSSGDDNRNDDDLVSVQQAMKDHDLYEGVSKEVVKAAHVFVREFSGKVSHLIVEEAGALSKGDDNKPSAEFLFKKHERFEKFSNIIASSFLEVLDGSWNGAAGLGREIYAPIEIKNRLLCQTVDSAFLRAGITLQAKTTGALQSTALIQAGAFNIIPQNYDVQQSSILGDLNAPIAVNRLLDQTISSNTGVYKAKMDKPEGNPRTAEEVKLNYQTQATLSNSAITRFYYDLDRIYAEVYRRVCMESGSSEEWAKMAKDFRKRCKDRGVSIEDLKKVEYVRAYRTVGNGSVYMRQEALNAVFSIVPMLPEIGKQRFIEDVIASNMNQGQVDRYLPREARENQPDQNHWEAQMENVAFKVGAPVSITPEQNAVIHSQVHLQAATQAAQSITQGANPVEVVAFLDRVGSHVATHLQSFANDPSRADAFKALQGQWKQIAALTDSLHKQLEQQAQQQAQAQAEQQAAQAEAQAVAQGMDPKMQIEEMKAKHSMALKEQQVQHNLKLKEVKTQHDLVLKDVKSAQNTRLAIRKQQVNEATQKAAAEAARESATASAE